MQDDETPLNVLKEDKQCYMWVYCSGADSPEAALEGMKNIVLFDYQNSRARACPAAFLGEYGGYLQTEAYGGLTQVKHLGCLALARRKFTDAKTLQGKGKAGKADVPWRKPKSSMRWKPAERVARRRAAGRTAETGEANAG
ncbi:hypothetical protein GCM10027342_01910 [Photobacterium alginatilyticum]